METKTTVHIPVRGDWDIPITFTHYLGISTIRRVPSLYKDACYHNLDRILVVNLPYMIDVPPFISPLLFFSFFWIFRIPMITQKYKILIMNLFESPDPNLEIHLIMQKTVEHAGPLLPNEKDQLLGGPHKISKSGHKEKLLFKEVILREDRPC